MKVVLKYQTKDQRISCEPETVMGTILSHFKVKAENDSKGNWQESRRNIIVLYK
jgi:hypothetical protein